VHELPKLDNLTHLTSLNLDVEVSGVQKLPALDKLAGLTSLAIVLTGTQIQNLWGLRDLASMKELSIEMPLPVLAAFPDDAKLRGATKLTLITVDATDQHISIPQGFRHISIDSSEDQRM
jgi:hypothetical protein